MAKVKTTAEAEKLIKEAIRKPREFFVYFADKNGKELRQDVRFSPYSLDGRWGVFFTGIGDTKMKPDNIFDWVEDVANSNDLVINRVEEVDPESDWF